MTPILAAIALVAGVSAADAADADTETPLPRAIAAVRSFVACQDLTRESVSAVLSASLAFSSRDENVLTYSSTVAGIGEMKLTCDSREGNQVELVPVASIVVDYLVLDRLFGPMGETVVHDPRNGGPMGTSLSFKRRGIRVKFSLGLRKENDDNVEIRKVTIRAVPPK